MPHLKINMLKFILKPAVVILAGYQVMRAIALIVALNLLF